MDVAPQRCALSTAVLPAVPVAVSPSTWIGNEALPVEAAALRAFQNQKSGSGSGTPVAPTRSSSKWSTDVNYSPAGAGAGGAARGDVAIVSPPSFESQ